MPSDSPSINPTRSTTLQHRLASPPSQETHRLMRRMPIDAALFHCIGDAAKRVSMNILQAKQLRRFPPQVHP
ncbi:hypothetical protein L596_023290 [Steinernema carpocapsae]|uniref:Uncharacterized protein n=1 Tax=Steinernema carpocapsae TaxID=34508 RepID=A0A4U5MD78_STECR|nr:hypothetical protein L596_023290 [Steinernema carpocapsae]